MRPRHPDDFYPTPLELCVAALRFANFEISDRYTLTILDPGCGTGVWGQAAKILWPNCWIVGVDIDRERLAIAEATGAYGSLIQRQYGAVTLTPSFDLVIGNPPFREAEFFVRRSFGLLSRRIVPEKSKPAAVLFLLRQAFTASQGRYQRMYNNGLKPANMDVVVNRPSFTGDGKTDATEYAIFTWRKQWRDGQRTTETDWLSWR
jgi:SAM-dependent methyltransferase